MENYPISISGYLLKSYVLPFVTRYRLVRHSITQSLRDLFETLIQFSFERKRSWISWIIWRIFWIFRVSCILRGGNRKRYFSVVQNASSNLNLEYLNGSPTHFKSIIMIRNIFFTLRFIFEKITIFATFDFLLCLSGLFEISVIPMIFNFYAHKVRLD